MYNIKDQSLNVSKDVKSLLSFVKTKSQTVEPFDFKPWRKEEDEIDPHAAINAEGKKIIEKLRHFISRQNIYEFMVNQEVSE